MSNKKVPKTVVETIFEFYRRQFILNDGSHQELGNLAYPSEMKNTISLGLAKPACGKEQKRCLCWYELTDSGIELMNQYIEEGLSIECFDGFEIVNQSVFERVSAIKI